MSDRKKPDQPPAEGVTYTTPDAAVTEDERRCDVVPPDDPTVRCTLHAGHGRVRPAGQATWYDHASPMQGAWWNVTRTASEWAVELAKLVPDISIPRQDGQPFGRDHADPVVVADVPTSVPEVIGAALAAAGVDQVKVELETWYGVFNDPAALLPKFESGELPENLRGPLLDNPIYETRSVSDALRHAQLTWEDRQAQHREQVRARAAQRPAYQVLPGGSVGVSSPPELVPPPTPIVIKSQLLVRLDWEVVSTDELRSAVTGPPARAVAI